MLYSEKMKEICEKLGVDIDSLPDKLYSTLLNKICDYCGCTPITITENGVYEAPEGVDGYSPITVDVNSGGQIIFEWDEIKTVTSGDVSASVIPQEIVTLYPQVLADTTSYFYTLDYIQPDSSKIYLAEYKNGDQVYVKKPPVGSNKSSVGTMVENGKTSIRFNQYMNPPVFLINYKYFSISNVDNTTLHHKIIIFV